MSDRGMFGRNGLQGRSVRNGTASRRINEMHFEGTTGELVQPKARPGSLGAIATRIASQQILSDRGENANPMISRFNRPMTTACGLFQTKFTTLLPASNRLGSESPRSNCTDRDDETPKPDNEGGSDSNELESARQGHLIEDKMHSPKTAREGSDDGDQDSCDASIDDEKVFAELKELSETLVALQDAPAKLEYLVSQLSAKVVSQKTDNDMLSGGLTNLEQELVQAEERADGLESSLIEATEKCNKFKADVEKSATEMQQEKATAEEFRISMEAQLQKDKNMISSLENEVHSLETQSKASLQSVKASENEVDQCRNEIQYLQAQFEKKIEQNQELNAQSFALLSQKNELEHSNRMLTSQLQETKQDVQLKAEEIQNLETKRAEEQERMAKRIVELQVLHETCGTELKGVVSSTEMSKAKAKSREMQYSALLGALRTICSGLAETKGSLQNWEHDRGTGQYANTSNAVIHLISTLVASLRKSYTRSLEICCIADQTAFALGEQRAYGSTLEDTISREKALQTASQKRFEEENLSLRQTIVETREDVRKLQGQLDRETSRRMALERHKEALASRLALSHQHVRAVSASVDSTISIFTDLSSKPSTFVDRLSVCLGELLNELLSSHESRGSRFNIAEPLIDVSNFMEETVGTQKNSAIEVESMRRKLGQSLNAMQRLEADLRRSAALAMEAVAERDQARACAKELEGQLFTLQTKHEQEMRQVMRDTKQQNLETSPVFNSPNKAVEKQLAGNALDGTPQDGHPALIGSHTNASGLEKGKGNGTEDSGILLTPGELVLPSAHDVPGLIQDQRVPEEAQQKCDTKKCTEILMPCTPETGAKRPRSPSQVPEQIDLTKAPRKANNSRARRKLSTVTRTSVRAPRRSTRKRQGRRQHTLLDESVVDLDTRGVLDMDDWVMDDE